MTTLVTGAAGFIGFHTCQALLNEGKTVVGLDNINDYYEIALKESRLAEIKDPNFHFERADIANLESLKAIFAKYNISAVINLAAQAGVRYSIENPQAYLDSNLQGFLNILECCRHGEVKHLVYASSSSVYGSNEKIPFSVTDNVDHPVSFYAATKKSNELMAHVYSHLYKIPTTGLRFFTVYGPWGRPDMSPFIFAKAILNEEPIKLFNFGNHKRDFTYIDDIVSGVLKVTGKPPVSSETGAPYKIYNIGNNDPVALLDYVKTLEEAIGKKAIVELAPLQPGDVETTYADIDELQKDFGYRPSTSLKSGIETFVNWYKQYYNYS